MANIVFAAPGTHRFHLHERLQRELLRRGHTVTTLCLDPGAYAFWHHQDIGAVWLPRGPIDNGTAPIDEFAQRERALGNSHRVRCHRRLRGVESGLRRWLDHNRADLMLLHQERGADAALLHFVAREHGSRVLWTGDGLLPHTLQVDERGLDGEAAASHRRVLDYRVVKAEPRLLAACLTHALADAMPSALTPKPVLLPPLARRVAAAWSGFADRGLAGMTSALCGWRHARSRPGPESRFPTMPAAPFVAVLLQAPDDARRRLDTTVSIDSEQLIEAASRCAAIIDPTCTLAVVDPRQGVALRTYDAANGVRVHRLHRSAAANAAATAVATVTINHPKAAVALLAGTPVVHLGNALYGLPGVTTRATLDNLDVALHSAMSHNHATLRQRFLTWVFGYGHVWCSGSHPDHNGMLGLVRTIEARLDSRERGPALHYRAGPAWPLTAEGRS